VLTRTTLVMGFVGFGLSRGRLKMVWIQTPDWGGAENSSPCRRFLRPHNEKVKIEREKNVCAVPANHSQEEGVKLYTKSGKMWKPDKKKEINRMPVVFLNDLYSGRRIVKNNCQRREKEGKKKKIDNEGEH